MFSAFDNGGYKGCIGNHDQYSISSLASGSMILALDSGMNSSYPGTGTTWYDLSGNNNHGTLQGGLRFDSKSKTFSFDGTNDYVSTTTSYTNPGPYTICVWFKTIVASGKKLVGFENAQTGTGSTGYDRQIHIGTDGKIYFGNYDGTADVAVSTTALNDNTWHYAVGTFGGEGTTMRLYIDGVSNATATSTTYQNFTGYWRIGAYKATSWTGASDGYYSGNIAIVNIYHRALSATEVAQNYYIQKRRFDNYINTGMWSLSSAYDSSLELPAVRSGLVALYDARDLKSYPGSGPTWYDISGNNNNGTIQSGVTFNSSGYFNFNGTSTGYVLLPLLSNSITNITMLALVQMPSSEGGTIFFNGSGSYGYGFGIGGSTFENVGNNAIGLFQTYRWIDTNTDWGTGWMLAGMQLNATSVPSFIKNSTYIGSFPGTNPGISGTTATIGTDLASATNRAFSGNIAWVAFYNRALSSGEIELIYNSLRGRFGI